MSGGRRCSIKFSGARTAGRRSTKVVGLQIAHSRRTASPNETPNIISSTTLIDTRGMRRGALAGLAAYGDAENALGAVVDGRNIILWRREKNEQKMVATVNDVVTTPLVHLRMK